MKTKQVSPEKILNIKWNAEKRAVETLVEWDKNPRQITEENYEKMKESIEKRGFHDVIKIDADGTIISGHQRKRALKEMGIKEVIVMVPERKLTDEERDSIAIESNRHRGEWNWDMLANTFDSKMLLESGFTNGELGFSMGETNGKENIDKDNLAGGIDSYLDGNIRQIVIFFKVDEFEAVVRRLDAVMADYGVTNHTEAVIKLLDFYEKNKAN